LLITQHERHGVAHSQKRATKGLRITLKPPTSIGNQEVAYDRSH
jgi:hypothetical protein